MLQDFDPELRLLCAFIAVPDAQTEERVSQATFGAGLNWDRFSDLVSRHRVSALVDSGLRHAPHFVVPDALRSRLAAAPDANAQSFLASVLCARQIVRGCRESGIACAVLKGVAVAQSAYQRSSEREMIDIDLLVDPAHFDQVEQMVLQMGFTRICPRADLIGDARAAFKAMHNAFTFFRASDGLQVDLHWRLVKNPCMLRDLNRSWPSRLASISAGGASLPVLAPAEHALYVLTHGAKSGWVRLKWLADADRIIRTLSADEHSVMLGLAAQEGIERLIGTSLHLTSQVLGTPLSAPLEDFASAHSDALMLALQRRLIAAPLPGKDKRLADGAQLITRIRHSLRLQNGADYRRAAILREVGNPEDLAIIALSPQRIGWLAIWTPLLAIARVFGLRFATR